jgi:hypothetical protein
MAEAQLRHKELPFQRLKLETIVIDTRSREVHCLNPTAARIWDLLEAETTIAELVQTLSVEYNVDRETLTTEVGAFMDEMAAKGLLTALQPEELCATGPVE